MEKRNILVTDAALDHYMSRVRKGAASRIQAQSAVVAAFAKPLFQAAGKDGATLLGLVDDQDKRFLALVGEDGNVVDIGPDSYWKEAREEWRKVGWNVNKGKPYAVQDATATITKARDLYADDDLRIDHNAPTTQDARGTWVQAWVLVTEDDLA